MRSFSVYSCIAGVIMVAISLTTGYVFRCCASKCDVICRRQKLEALCSVPLAKIFCSSTAFFRLAAAMRVEMTSKKSKHFGSVCLF